MHQQNAGKLDDREQRCLFLGYGSDNLGYRLWDAQDKKVIRSRDVVFNEEQMFYKNEEKIQKDDIPLAEIP